MRFLKSVLLIEMEPRLECRVMVPCFMASGLHGLGEQATLSRGSATGRCPGDHGSWTPLLDGVRLGTQGLAGWFEKLEGGQKVQAYAPLGAGGGTWGAPLCALRAPFSGCTPSCRRHALTLTPGF